MRPLVPLLRCWMAWVKVQCRSRKVPNLKTPIVRLRQDFSLATFGRSDRIHAHSCPAPFGVHTRR
jgi:hypothetical protein